MDDEALYSVDFIFHTLDGESILEIAEHDELWGKDMDEPLICIEEKIIDSVVLMSPDKKPTLKVMIDGVACIKFGSSQEEYETFLSAYEECMPITIIGRCNKNEWNGRVFPQLFIEDYAFGDMKRKFTAFDF